MNAENCDWTGRGDSFCWAAAGSKLLVQQARRIRILDASNQLREGRTFEIDDGVVIAMGRFDDDWWLVLLQDQGVVFQRGLQGERQRLVGAEGMVISLPTLSPDGKILACAVPEGVVRFWSVVDGEQTGGVQFDMDAEFRDIFGAPKFGGLFWAPNSRHLAVWFAFPMDQIAVLDVLDQSIVGIIDPL